MRKFLIGRALPSLLALALCLTTLPLQAAARAPDRAIPIGESGSFSCGSGNGGSYTWWMDENGYDLFTISHSGSSCTLKAKKPGRTQLWVQYSVTLYGPGLDQFGNLITVRYPDGYETTGWLVEAVGRPCTVTFVPGGGSAPVTQPAYEGGTVSAPNITRPGFVVDGWYTDAALTRRYGFSTPLSGDLTLYAGWLPARTVTFVSMGRTDVQTVADGRTASPPSPDALRGYAFEGWHTDAACTRPYGFASPVTADLTLYAKWRPLDEAVVSFDCMDGSKAVQVTCYAGETPVPPDPPGREGMEFTGWYRDAGCGADSLYRFDTPLDGPLALYAGWRRIDPVRVLLDRQDGSAPEARWVLRGEPLEEPETPEREGHLFQGWYTAPSCYEAWDFSDPVKSSMTLYAGWVRREYTVEFINSIPTGEFSSEDTLWRTVSVAHGDTVEEPASQPSGGLNLFTGWSDGSRIYDFSRPVTGDLTLRTERIPFDWNDYGGTLRKNSDITWALDTSDCVLTLSGSGDTGGYTFDSVYKDFPDWYGQRLKIGEIRVEEGVDRIGTKTFSWCCNAVAASLPEGLESIGSQAFDSCFDLTEVNIPSTVAFVEDGAFQDCGSLRRIELPDGVTELPANVFDGCRSLKDVSLPEGLESIGESAFLSCERLEALALPGTLTRLDSRALSGSGLRELRVPGGVRELGEYVFQNCRRLENAVLEEGVESIGRFAFDGCGSLRTLVIPESVKEIGEWAFDFSSAPNGPVHIFYAGSREQWEHVSIHGNNNLDRAVLHFGCPESGTLESVFFDSRGGTPVEAQLRLPGERLEEPRSPEREGYAFSGWYRDSACGEAWDFEWDRIDGETTLCAGWTPLPHTVRFSGGGSQTVLHGERAEEPAVPVQAGARFNGWYTDEEARTLYLFHSPVTEDLDLYPGWLMEQEGPENTLWVRDWLENTVTLIGPERELEALQQVWAASYREDGSLASAAAGRLNRSGGPDGAEAVFPIRLEKGWKLFFLDAGGRPLRRSGVLQ